MSKVVTFDWLKISSPEIFYPIYFKLVGAPDCHGTIKEFQKLVLNIFLDASIENPDIELIVR